MPLTGALRLTGRTSLLVGTWSFEMEALEIGLMDLPTTCEAKQDTGVQDLLDSQMRSKFYALIFHHDVAQFALVSAPARVLFFSNFVVLQAFRGYLDFREYPDHPGLCHDTVVVALSSLASARVNPETEC